MWPPAPRATSSAARARAELRRKIARAVTDPGDEVRADDTAKPGITNLLRIYSALTGEPVEAIESRYAGTGYGAFKKDLAEVVTGALAPIRERTEKLLADEPALDKLPAPRPQP